MDVFVLDRRTGKIDPGAAAGRASRAPARELSASRRSRATGRIVAYTYRPAAKAGATVVSTRARSSWPGTARTAAVTIVSRNAKGSPQGGCEPAVRVGRRAVRGLHLDLRLARRHATHGQQDVFRYDRTTRHDRASSRPAADGPHLRRAPRQPVDLRATATWSPSRPTAATPSSTRTRDPGPRSTSATSSRAATERDLASRRTGGPPSNRSTEPAISADGRYVAFASQATNLVTGPAQGSAGLFRRRPAHRRRRCWSRCRAEAPARTGPGGQPAITADGADGRLRPRRRPTSCPETAGRIAPAAASRYAPVRGVHARHRRRRDGADLGQPRPDRGRAARASSPRSRGGGRYVAFASDSPNLVAGDDNDAAYDVFLRDLPPGPGDQPGRRSTSGRAPWARRACPWPRPWRTAAGRR